jgi:hypothetical protein
VDEAVFPVNATAYGQDSVHDAPPSAPSTKVRTRESPENVSVNELGAV